MIFYFSGTGNTRWAAEHLAAATGERLLFIPDELKGDCQYELAEGERIGFCFPTHGWQPPRIVRQFIRRLKIRDERAEIRDGHYCYALTTCGDSIGRTMEILNKELDAVGLHAVSVFSLTMPESYVCLPFMYTDSPTREREKIEIGTRELEHCTDLIVRRVPNEIHTQRGLTPWTFSHVIGAYFNARMITDKPFTVDADHCIHCGKCAQVCPICPVGTTTAHAPTVWLATTTVLATPSTTERLPANADNIILDMETIITSPPDPKLNVVEENLYWCHRSDSSYTFLRV